jgi:acyl-CoA thioester hydrolase
VPAPFVTTQRLRFCDTDQMGHVNNAVYAVMCEAGRAELMLATGLIAPQQGRGVAIVRLELDFLREMTWPGEVRIETELARFGTKSLQLRQRVTLNGETVARALSVLVVIDTTSRRALPITPEWRAALQAYAVES